MEKELEKNIDTLTKDITSYIPHNIVEIVGAYAFSLVMALLVFIIGKWVVNKIVEFEDGYISYKDTMLKIDSYKVDYSTLKPHSMPIVIDYAKELIGVVEYVTKETNTSTAIFKDRIIKDWNK